MHMHVHMYIDTWLTCAISCCLYFQRDTQLVLFIYSRNSKYCITIIMTNWLTISNQNKKSEINQLGTNRKEYTEQLTVFLLETLLIWSINQLCRHSTFFLVLSELHVHVNMALHVLVWMLLHVLYVHMYRW